jgi:thermitase
MNVKFYTLTLIFFMCIAVQGQNSEPTCRVILKLKNESAYVTAQRSSQAMIGNVKIDSVAKKFMALKMRKQFIGKMFKQSIYIIQFPKEANIQHAIEEYYKTNEIEYAEPDYMGSVGGIEGVNPNDQYFYRQWGISNDGTFSLSPSVVGADIDMRNAWTISQGDSNIIVGIIDTGTKLDHPEFAGRIWKNNREIPNNGIDDDANGYIDDVQGWDFANSDNDPTDDYGHGTNVTGIIGANGNNSIGYAGVDWNCKLMILKGINNNNFGYYSWWADAIYYAVNNGAKVINMSVGGTSSSITLQNAINYALANQVTVVASMMNTNTNVVAYPAGISGVIAVGSTNSNDVRTNPFFWSSTSGSNFGNHLSVVAPGNYIYGLNYMSNTNYSTYWGGTSQATPLVTGLISLLLAQNPNRTPLQMKSIIEATAQDQVGNLSEDTPGWDQYYGYGRINAYKALTVTSNMLRQRMQSNKISISPNPFSTQATLKTDVAFQNAKLTVINSLGQKVAFMENINGQSLVFNRGNLSNGLYYMVVQQDNQVFSKIKVIVKD